MKSAPCLDCANRHEACWSDCEQYKAWRGERDVVISASYEERQRNSMLRSVQKRGIKRTGKKLHDR